MVPKVYGIEHILYIVITTLLAAVGLILAIKFVKKQSTKVIILKVLAGLLLVSILANRLSQVFRYEQTRWHLLIPDSFCGMTSLIVSLAVLIGKRDNDFLHFAWLLGLFGGISTVVYPTFVSQNVSFFYIPTISGLLHHSFCATTVVAMLIFKHVEITYKKWKCVLFGFTCYLTVGAFQMSVFNMSDAFHIVEPLLSYTPLTVWVMAPIYVAVHGAIFAVIELVKRKKQKAKESQN